jgi:hypothetical protein
VAVELYHGNVHILLAAAIVLGFRHPWNWSFVLLTKVTPGVGLLWFLVRREWRPLLIAVGVTAAVAGVSFIAAPGTWFEWLRARAANSSVTTTVSVPLPIWVRLPAGGLLIIWGARTDRRWTVPVGSMIALPVLWFAGFAMLAALPALARRPQPSSASAASTT